MARFVKGDVVVVLFPFSDLSDVSNFSFFRSFLRRSIMQSMDWHKERSRMIPDESLEGYSNTFEKSKYKVIEILSAVLQGRKKMNLKSLQSVILFIVNWHHKNGGINLPKKIWLSSPHMSGEGYELQYVKEAFDTNWIAPLGPNVDAFEKELAAWVGAKHAAALSSGTAAIHMALKAAGVEKDDLVFCQSLTFSATANPIVYQNATPVFIDSDFKTWNMDPQALEDAFKKYPNPKAVILTHLYGLSADLDPIIRICQDHNVTLIEDAAESLGTKYKGKYTGTFGKYGVFSFNGNKIITTSGGGMLVSSDEERIAKVRFWSTQARDKARHYEHSELGYNYRMSNVLAGIGRGQLKVLDRRLIQKSTSLNSTKKT